MRANVLFPGRPYYRGPRVGWFVAIHHDLLFERSWFIRERVRYVKQNKPKHEVAIRLWNMMRIDDSKLTTKMTAMHDSHGTSLMAVSMMERKFKKKVLAYVLARNPRFMWREGIGLDFSDENRIWCEKQLRRRGRKRGKRN